MSERCNRCYAELAQGANYCARCGALVAGETPEQAHDPMLGRVLLGRYRVQRVLGEGGMGRVYLAEQAMGQATRPVAIKALRKELISDPKGSGRFLRESEIVIRLAHPNTIQFYDFAQLDDGTPLIVMEYIEGRTLAEALRDGPLAHERARTLLVQICGSLAEAHAQGFVHRDLKPHNVLLTARAGHDDFVKVLDFGIAFQQSDAGQDVTRLTTQGSLIGTPPYMSPEQFQALPVDARSDVYALGVMAYEMLSGQLPFEAKTAWQWAHAHIDQPPKPLAEHAAARDLPEHSIAAVMRALHKDPAQRPSDAGALLREYLGPDAALRDELRLSLPALPRSQPPRLSGADDDQSALPMAPTVRAPRPKRRRRRPKRALAAIALLIAVALTVALRHRSAPGAASAARAAAGDDAAANGSNDIAPAKRARGVHRHGADVRANDSEAAPPTDSDELNALAARADQLHATDPREELDPPSSAPQRIRSADDARAAVEAAIEANDIAGAASALAVAEHAAGLDPAALGALREHLSDAAESAARNLAEARNCKGLNALAEGLRSAAIAPPDSLQPGLETCAKDKQLHTDGGVATSQPEHIGP